MGEEVLVTYYSHTQEIPSKWSTAAAVAGGGLIWAMFPGGFVARLAVLAATAFTASTFRALTVNVDTESLNFSFGNGNLIRKSYPLSSIKEATPIRTTPLQGWGIHYIGKGWLYNVYGLDAVDVELHDGKHIFVGTDQPTELAEVINKHRSAE